MNVHVLGIFDAAVKAAAAAATFRAVPHDAAIADVSVYAPTFDHHIDAALGPGKSPVRVFTLIGGLLGCLLGFAFPIYTVLDWPLITGGKAIISIPPFVVIAFELTILFGALMTVVGFLLTSGLPRVRSPRGAGTGVRAMYDKRFSDDRWGVLVTCAAERATAVRAQLERDGAEEVRSADDH
jgi:Alternative complex III, ActD subunit